MAELEFDNPSESEQRKSKYNSAIAQLYRLDKLWQEAHKFGSSINYGKLNEILDRIWLELSSDTKKKDEQLIKIDEQLLQLPIYGISDEFKIQHPELYKKIILAAKYLLMRKEEILRRLQNEQGKGTAYEDSIEDYMDDGY